MKKLIVTLAIAAALALPMISIADVTTQKGNPVATEQTLISKYAYDANGNIEYIGKAEPKTPTDSKGWLIQKFIYTDGNLTGIFNANGQPDFNKVWDNRESYSYE